MELAGKRVVVLAENNYQELELWYPVLRLREAGAEVQVAGPGRGSYVSKYGYPVKEDVKVSEVDVGSIDAVIIPGGFAPDAMRTHEATLALVSAAFHQGKVVAAICHAGWVLISAGIVRGRRVTGVRAIRDDLVNAGGSFVDAAVVQDGKLITSRLPADLPAFCRAIIDALR